MWVKVDDKLHSHPKIGGLSQRSLGLHLLALSYCGDQLTDGLVPGWWASRTCEDARQISELVQGGVWETVEEGYQIHDWLDFNPSREQILAEREAGKERRKRSAERRANGRRTSSDPTRPDPVKDVQ